MFECFFCVESFCFEVFLEVIVLKFDYSNVFYKEIFFLCLFFLIDIDVGFLRFYWCCNEFLKSDVYFIILWESVGLLLNCLLWILLEGKYRILYVSWFCFNKKFFVCSYI